MTAKQSTNHIFMLEPVDFYANPQTFETNAYQHEDSKDTKAIQQRALAEFRAFRDMLVTNGVAVTTGLGQKGCPDDIFCNNWVSTHEARRMVLYPMLADNRKIERREDLFDLIRKSYTDVMNFALHEQQGKYLESTGALCLDRVNKIAYVARSPRSDEDLAKLWCQTMGYTLVAFDTEHNGKPVYHTDVVMWIGTDVAGICSGCLKNKSIVDALKKNRDVVEFTNDQMKSFCGNALEVVANTGEKKLVMSASGFNSLTPEQKKALGKHYKTVIQPNIPTIEYYGGGSARCMLLEMF
jgi:hypothetical protein